jgi:Arc/MetJ-type ribon-helix-helix transcriptional regulator
MYIPLSPKLEKALDNLINTGYAKSSAEAVTKAILEAEENEAINAVRESEEYERKGKLLTGNPRKLLARNYK